MAQHIGIQIVDENGKSVSYSDLNLAQLQKFVAATLKYEDFPLLSSIDEYALTYYNSKQTKIFLEELKKINVPLDLRECVDELSAFTSQVEQHQLVKIIGD